jgi:hypothetical protein|tara:strand:+ start:311 stop:583 length:273 start_codon:yes stop_codon:yes gene_type:complete
MTLSICIPKLHKNVTKNTIKSILDNHNFGTIKKIDIVYPGKNKIAFVHYSSWNDNEKSLKVKNILKENNDFKIFYDGPWYWKCYKANNKA